ncbi:cell division control protein [Capsaspora owczarzaki ATCC 30864]|uniref:cell division control protein n=1 Tax=Capsaspora owczarzaki (strain ATCC 30864) TaxID=595528 RepID=UPI000352700A|nr:cell division control protein [Capsaspora owczarzaki ATCC 30864]|eukprot:XP_004346282.2 cell division control protein [Capsaspora owczarzaki ATCC 30864]
MELRHAAASRFLPLDSQSQPRRLGGTRSDAARVAQVTAGLTALYERIQAQSRTSSTRADTAAAAAAATASAASLGLLQSSEQSGVQRPRGFETDHDGHFVLLPLFAATAAASSTHRAPASSAPEYAEGGHESRDLFGAAAGKRGGESASAGKPGEDGGASTFWRQNRALAQHAQTSTSMDGSRKADASQSANRNALQIKKEKEEEEEEEEDDDNGEPDWLTAYRQQRPTVSDDEPAVHAARRSPLSSPRTPVKQQRRDSRHPTPSHERSLAGPPSKLQATPKIARDCICLLNSRYACIKQVAEGTFAVMIQAVDTFTHSNAAFRLHPQSSSQPTSDMDCDRKAGVSPRNLLPSPSHRQHEASRFAIPPGCRRVAIKIMHKPYAAIGEEEAKHLRRLNLADRCGFSPVVRLLNTFTVLNDTVWVSREHDQLRTPRGRPSSSYSNTSNNNHNNNHNNHNSASPFEKVETPLRKLHTIPPASAAHQSSRTLLGEWVQQRPATAVAMQRLRKIAAQLLSAMIFLEDQAVIHADLKPENILRCPRSLIDDSSLGHEVDHPSFSIRLVDFGNAVSCKPEFLSLYHETFELQTLVYRAPEVLFGCEFGFQIDMWSVGCILAELSLGRPIFSGDSPASLVQSIFELLGPFPQAPFAAGKFNAQFQEFLDAGPAQLDDSQDREGEEAMRIALLQSQRLLRLSSMLGTHDIAFLSFIDGLLKYNPAERLTPQAALGHPFLGPLFPFRSFLSKKPYPLSGCESDVVFDQPLLRQRALLDTRPAWRQTDSHVSTGQATLNVPEADVPVPMKEEVVASEHCDALSPHSHDQVDTADIPARLDTAVEDNLAADDGLPPMAEDESFAAFVLDGPSPDKHDIMTRLSLLTSASSVASLPATLDDLPAIHASQARFSTIPPVPAIQLIQPMHGSVHSNANRSSPAQAVLSSDPRLHRALIKGASPGSGVERGRSTPVQLAPLKRAWEDSPQPEIAKKMRALDDNVAAATAAPERAQNDDDEDTVVLLS